MDVVFDVPVVSVKIVVEESVVFVVLLLVLSEDFVSTVGVELQIEKITILL